MPSLSATAFISSSSNSAGNSFAIFSAHLFRCVLEALSWCAFLMLACRDLHFIVLILDADGRNAYDLDVNTKLMLRAKKAILNLLVKKNRTVSYPLRTKIQVIAVSDSIYCT
mmetsp:Transcript_39310/g.57837  ORF Transcript_39310/g.57837 Transcript_39310/m.57837 type:complete len:112 (+) Transcript_39310:1296-1631(+)